MLDTRGEKVFYTFNYIFMTLLVAFMVAPFINVIAVSLSSEEAVISGFVYLWPKEFTTFTYKAVFKGSMLIQSLKNTVYMTIVGTAINMFMTIAAAYPLSKKRLKGRNLILLFISLTMLINAGMIPNFILVKQLKLINSYWAIWLTGAISTYNLIVLKTFFQSIPDSLEESAAMDGCSDLGILLRIVLPLSGPALATIALFYAVGHWNSYFNVMLYITSSVKATLQVRLRDLINMSSMDTIKNAIMDSQDQQTIGKHCLTCWSRLPIMTFLLITFEIVFLQT